MKILACLKKVATDKLFGVTLAGVAILVPTYYVLVLPRGSKPPPARTAPKPAGPTRPCGGTFLAQDAAGAWRVRMGDAQVGGIPMTGGADDMALAANGTDLLLRIPGGPPVTLSPVAADGPRWEWTKSSGRPLDSDALEKALDCDFEAVTRYQGTVSFASDGDGTPSAATFRLAMLSRNRGLLLWELTAPTRGEGYFQIERR